MEHLLQLIGIIWACLALAIVAEIILNTIALLQEIKSKKGKQNDKNK